MEVETNLDKVECEEKSLSNKSMKDRGGFAFISDTIASKANLLISQSGLLTSNSDSATSPQSKIYSDQSKIDSAPSKFDSATSEFDSDLSKIDSAQSEIYSTPSEIDSTPSKIDFAPSKTDVSSQPSTAVKVHTNFDKTVDTLPSPSNDGDANGGLDGDLDGGNDWGPDGNVDGGMDGGPDGDVDGGRDEGLDRMIRLQQPYDQFAEQFVGTAKEALPPEVTTEVNGSPPEVAPEVTGSPPDVATPVEVVLAPDTDSQPSIFDADSVDSGNGCVENVNNFDFDKSDSRSTHIDDDQASMDSAHAVKTGYHMISEADLFSSDDDGEHNTNIDTSNTFDEDKKNEMDYSDNSDYYFSSNKRILPRNEGSPRRVKRKMNLPVKKIISDQISNPKYVCKCNHKQEQQQTFNINNNKEDDSDAGVKVKVEAEVNGEKNKIKGVENKVKDESKINSEAELNGEDNKVNDESEVNGEAEVNGENNKVDDESEVNGEAELNGEDNKVNDESDVNAEENKVKGQSEVKCETEVKGESEVKNEELDSKYESCVVNYSIDRKIHKCGAPISSPAAVGPMGPACSKHSKDIRNHFLCPRCMVVCDLGLFAICKAVVGESHYYCTDRQTMDSWGDYQCPHCQCSHMQNTVLFFLKNGHKEFRILSSRKVLARMSVTSLHRLHSGAVVNSHCNTPSNVNNNGDSSLDDDDSPLVAPSNGDKAAIAITSATDQLPDTACADTRSSPPSNDPSNAPNDGSSISPSNYPNNAPRNTPSIASSNGQFSGKTSSYSSSLKSSKTKSKFIARPFPSTHFDHKWKAEILPDLSTEDKDNLKTIIRRSRNIFEPMPGDGDSEEVAAKNIYDDCLAGTCPSYRIGGKNLDINAKLSCNQNESSIHAAARSGSLLCIAYLNEQKVDFEELNDEGKTALMVAISCRQSLACLYLMTFCLPVKCVDTQGRSSLHLAAAAGLLNIVVYIVDVAGEHINIKDNQGRVPLHHALENNNANIVDFLLARGADDTITDFNGDTVLHFASIASNRNLLKKFQSPQLLNAKNKEGNTPLHIAAKKNKIVSVFVLVRMKADLTITNDNKKVPLQCCTTGSECFTYLKLQNSFMTHMKSQQIKQTSKTKILSHDISNGKEYVPIKCVNCVDDTPAPNVAIYIKDNVETLRNGINRSITALRSCKCSDCTTSNCICSLNSVKCWYTQEGTLSSEYNFMSNATIFECHQNCKCDSTCRNRCVQNGIHCRLEVFRTKNAGWGVKALLPITRGTFVCEYVGELLDDKVADSRNDDSYLFDLDYDDHDSYCIDARKYGNIARYINHKCQPNLSSVKVFMDHQDLRFPHICFFANQDIAAGTELGFDYGAKFWIIKGEFFKCACGDEECRYDEEHIEQTLKMYKNQAPGDSFTA